MSGFYVDYKSDPNDAAASLAAQHDVDGFARGIINGELNSLIANFDQSDLFSHLGGRGEDERAVPYAGWFWRSVDFFGKYGVTIAECDGETVVCESNKWDYEERPLTDEERATFLALVWEAKRANRRGGQLSEINKATALALLAAGDYIRSLDVKP